MKNPYRKSSHLEASKSRQIIRCFAEDFTATQTSKLLGIRRSTINSRYDYIRQAVFWSWLTTDKEMRNWIIEVDESYFWTKRIKSKRWRWAWWKTKVLLLLKREYVLCISNIIMYYGTVYLQLFIAIIKFFNSNGFLYYRSSGLRLTVTTNIETETLIEQPKKEIRNQKEENG